MYEAVKIKKCRIVARNIKEIIFERRDDAKAGQFYMVWLPGVDEFPMSISRIKNDERGIMVKVIGEGTKKLYEKDEGEKIWIRGPYGRGYSNQENALIVAGGIGIASLLPLTEVIKDYTLIIGAKSVDELIRIDAKNIIYCTDDGSFGLKGTAVHIARKYMEERDFSIVYGCGPEPMLYALFKLCEEFGIKCQLSLERYMKCGIGLCGSCEIDGYLVCKDGPVFSSEELRKMESFGKFKRDESGRLLRL